MQTLKNKFENISNEHLISIYKKSNFILPLKLQKNLYVELASSRFLSNFKNIRKPGTCKWSDTRCKICQNYLNEGNKFTMSNVEVRIGLNDMLRFKKKVKKLKPLKKELPFKRLWGYDNWTICVEINSQYH